MVENAERTPHTALLSWEPLLYPITFGAALLLRIGQLGVFAAWDELAWTFRSVKFFQGLAQVGHGARAAGDPSGTVTLWTGSLGLALRRLLEGSAASPIWQDLAGQQAFEAQSPDQLRLLAAVWPAAKLPTAVLLAAMGILLTFLVARLWGARAALFAGLLLAVTPYYLAVSRILAPGALTAALMLAALLALLWALQRPRPWLPAILSGTLCGLAVLNQGAAAILVPYGLLLLAVGHLAGRRPALTWVGSSALWLLGALLGALLLYPGTWSAPAAALQMLWARSVQAMQAAGRTPPGPAEIAALGLRLDPLTLAGLALAILGLPLVKNRRRLPAVALLVFAAGLLLLSPRAGHEDGAWALPAVPALGVLAAVGLDGVPALLGRLAGRGGRRRGLALEGAVTAALLAAIAWQASAVIKYHPYYPAYRNPWLAQRAGVDLAGWGEGMDQAAGYLNAQPRARQARVAIQDVAALAPFFAGETVPLSEDSLARADFVVTYNRDWLQPGPLLAPLSAQTPVETVRLFGAEYARIYANRLYEPILQSLAGLAPEDVIVLDARSPFPRHYEGQAPYREMETRDGAQVAADLNSLAAGRWHLWHVSFDGADPLHLLGGMLESEAMLVQRRQVPGVTISTYLLPLQVRFTPLEADQRVGLQFPGGLILDRAGLAPSQVQYRQRIGLTLAWSLGERPATNLAISLRLVDPRGEQWAQHDEWIADLDGHYTSAWEGDEALSRHMIAVPAGLPPGPYRLEAILYEADTLKPLAPVDPSGPWNGRAIDLFALEVLPPQMPPALGELALEHPLEVTLADGVELLGYQAEAGPVEAGQATPLKLWWRVTQPLTTTYRARLMLLDAKGDLRGDQVVELASAEHPTTTWTRGEVVEGRYWLGVEGGAVSGEGLLGVQLVGPRGPVGPPIRITALPLVGFEHVFQPPAMQKRRQETLDQKVRLLGYDLEPAQATPGQAVRLTLYWQALAPMRTDYTVFTHLLDPAGTLCAGHDSMPVNGTRRTRSWVLHEVLTDVHEIVVPESAAAGRYAIEVGLYDAATGVRVPAYNSSGTRLAQDRILLGTITVQ